MADDHAEDVPVRHEGAHPDVDAHLREADLVLRPILVLEGVLRERLLVRAPAHLGGRGAFLAEALDRPGVHEFVDLLRLVGDLGVALGAVDDLHAELLREETERAGRDQAGDLFGAGAPGLLVLDEPVADVDQALLDEVRDEAGVGAVLDDGGRALGLPLLQHAPQVHVAVVEGLGGRVGIRAAGVGIPQLGRGVDVAHAVFVAPLENLTGVDVPGQVDEDVTGADILGQQLGHVALGHAIAHEADTLLDPRRELRLAVGEIHHGDVPRGHLQVLEEDGQGALGHGAVTDEQDLIFEWEHEF